MAILKSKVHLVDYWKENGDFYKTIRPYHGDDHRDWDTSSKIVKGMGAREELLVESIDNEDIHSSKIVQQLCSVTEDGIFDGNKVSSGNLPNGNIVIKYNRKKYNGVILENSDTAYDDFIKTLHPFLQKHVQYMDFIRQDCSNYSDGKLYEKLYGGKISLGKLTNAQRPGIHTEVLVLNELIKDKQNITSVADIRALDIKIVIRWKVKGQIFKQMVTCPHCFYITEGVFFPNSK
ncbi:hypothetical protein JJC04_06275 [Flavobacterium covae]|nr:hypothetical protein JJC04_06275 [Flavobacterium covae]